jgi:hypothetical protein
MADVIDKNGKKVLGKQGSLASLGLDTAAKTRRPIRPSVLERRQAIEQGRDGAQRGLQEKATEGPPPDPGSDRLKKKAKKRFGANNE